jgi:predicted RNA-binding protein with RPS1 domain
MSHLDDYEGDTANDRKRLSELMTDQLEELARAIHSRDQLVRARAASRLVNLNVDPDLVLPALTHPRPMVREVAAEAIGYSQKPLSPMVIDTLLAAIDDPKTFVAAAAIRTLGRRLVSDARDQISACLDDPEPPIVAAAIVALARLGDHTLASAIPDFLNSPHLVIRIAAAEAAGLLHVSAAIPGLLKFLEECIAQHTTQQHIPSRAASVAMQSLARLQARSAVPLLIEIACYVVGLRTLAVRTLIQLHAVEAAPALIPLLNEEGSHLLNEVIRFFHTVDYRPAAPALRNVLERATVQNRALIKKLLSILAEWHDEQSIPLMSHIAAHDPSAEIRHHATRCLTALRQTSATSTTTDQDRQVPTIVLPTLDNERLQQRRKRLAQLSIEQVVEGTVLRVLRYGAVIDVSGVEGFVHVGEIDWRWIGDARHALQPGQMVRVMITDIDEERLRVNLSIRRLSPDPWRDVSQRFTVGMQVKGIVTGITGFGLFIELAPGVQGLAHISHIPPDQQPLPQKFVPGREVQGVILSIDNERRRIALSLYTELQQKTV